MTMNPLPPQAYTKDIMLKAYSWLMGQSNSIKEMATTPDILVSLYLKATRDGDGALDRPSITNFKNELKSLAGLLGELDKAPSIPSTIPMPSIHEPTLNKPMASSLRQAPPQQSHFASATSSAAVSAAAPAPASVPNTESSIFGLDSGSLAMIQEVKEGLNLSNDSEALRMIIKVGYTRAKAMLLT